MGCFAEVGWAWNVKAPDEIIGRRKAAIPSAELVDSFVIFLYGVSNVWLEHLAAWGSAWSAQDFEHVSISLAVDSVACSLSRDEFVNFSIRRLHRLRPRLAHNPQESICNPRRLTTSR